MSEYAPLSASLHSLSMKTRISLSLITVLTAIPFVTSAISIQPTDFTDVRDVATRSALRVMVERGAVASAKKFYLARKVNRAEFAKIILLAGYPHLIPEYKNSCFADVPSSAWYAPWTCILQSNGITGYDASNSGLRLFKPSQNVTYAEAVKIMLLVFDIGGTESLSDEIWYQSSFDTLQVHGLPLRFAPHHELTRAETVRFVHEMLSKFDPSPSFSSTSSSSSVRSSSSSTSKPFSSSSSSVSTLPLDPIADTKIRTQFILLGETSPVIGAAKFFIEEEPLDVTSISVNLLSDISTVQSLLVYDDDRRYLGRATLNTATSSTNRNYRLEIPVGMFTVGKREDRSVYFRAQLASKDAGGLGNQTVQISNVIVQGNGGWSNRAYTKQSSTSDVFPVFVTSRSTIVSVSNAGQANAALVTGTNQLLGMFTFVGRKTDSSAKINLTDLVFQIEQTGQVTLSNVKIGTSGFPDRTNCLVSDSLATCANLPESLGSLTDLPRTIAVYGDVTAGDAMHASLRLTLNDAGSSSTDGAVTWTDGTSVFTWVAVDSPVVLGTHYKY